MSDVETKEKILELYSEEKWSMSKLGRESDFSRHQVRQIIMESEDVEKRSHKEACNTKDFKNKLKEANEGKNLSKEHKEKISEGINNSDAFQEAMENQSERLRKDVSNEKLKQMYFELNENARKVSEHVDLSRRRVLSRLKEEGIDTSQDEPWNKGKELTDEHKERLSEAKKGKTWEEIYGEEHAQWRRENIGKKISESKKGYSRKPEVIAKLRKKRIEEIKKRRNDGNQISPSYNENAIEIIEEFGRKNDYDFQHAENGGEFFIRDLNCWVDGYDREKDVIVEVYENYHYKDGELRDKDVRREKHIQNVFQPNKFYRIKIDKNDEVLKTLEI